MPTVCRLTALSPALLLCLLPLTLRAQTAAGGATTPSPAASAATESTSEPTTAPEPSATPPSAAPKSGNEVERSWTILEAAVIAKAPETRAPAVRTLGMLPNNPRATALAIKALSDENSDIREAATDALGAQKAFSAKNILHKTIETDKDPAVILGAARALLAMNDDFGYDVFYAVLTGEKKSGAGLMEEQKKMLHDPQKLAQLSLEQGVNFVPFGGIGLMIVRKLTKDDSAPVRAGAAKVLASDPDIKSLGALESATHDKSWIVQVASIIAISQRNDQTTMSTLVLVLDDPNEVVRATAAAAVIHLHDLKSVPAQKAVSRKKSEAKH